jgi:hypothetical protein
MSVKTYRTTIRTIVSNDIDKLSINTATIILGDGVMIELIDGQSKKSSMYIRSGSVYSFKPDRKMNYVFNSKITSLSNRKLTCRQEVRHVISFAYYPDDNIDISKKIVTGVQKMIKDTGIARTMIDIGTKMHQITENKIDKRDENKDIEIIDKADEEDIVTKSESFIRLLAMAICLVTGDKIDSVFSY